MTRLQQALASLILFAVCVAILGTEPEVQRLAGSWLDVLEFGFGLVFAIEYLVRVAVAGVDPVYRGFFGRLRFMRRPMAIVDALAVFPFVLGLLGVETILLRLLRVLRLMALTKLTRYSEAMRLVWDTVAERRHELLFSVAVAATLILISAAGMYVLEGDTNPAFASIPRAIWYAAAVLTTVGFGDVVPATLGGKVFSVLAALAGIGLIALPAGILAGAFNEAFARQRERRRRERGKGPGGLDASAE